MDDDIYITIVVPTFKRTDYLERLLNSIKNQTFKNYEVIVVDDASPNSEEYLELSKRFEVVFDDFRYVRKTLNSGAPNSRNLGAKLSKYSWLSFVDDDDEWLPDKLLNQIKIIREPQTHLGIVYSWTDAIDQKGQVVHKYRDVCEGFCMREIMSSCFIPSPSVLVKKSAFNLVGGFDEKMPSCQDWDTWVRIIFFGYAVECSRTVDVIYHKHDGPTIGTASKSLSGYIRFYRKHIFKLLVYKPRFVVRWFKLEVKNFYRLVFK